MPGVNLPESWSDLFQPDKLAHIFVYAVQVFLFLRGFHLTNKLTRKISFFVVLGTILYGISLEIVQYAFFEDRFFEVFDIIANIIGSFTGWLIFKKNHK